MALVRIWKLVEGQIAWHWTGRVRLRLGACLGGSARVCTVRSIAELQNFHNPKWTVTRPLSVSETYQGGPGRPSPTHVGGVSQTYTRAGVGALW
jgi:hypothetical protein